MGMKVYCNNCKHLGFLTQKWCGYKKEKKYSYTHYKKKWSWYGKDSSLVNKDNDCKHYKSKWWKVWV